MAADTVFPPDGIIFLLCLAGFGKVFIYLCLCSINLCCLVLQILLVYEAVHFRRGHSRIHGSQFCEKAVYAAVAAFDVFRFHRLEAVHLLVGFGRLINEALDFCLQE